jgi:hypothetical protein
MIGSLLMVISVFAIVFSDIFSAVSRTFDITE